MSPPPDSLTCQLCQGPVLLGLVLGRWAMGEALPRVPHMPTYRSLCPEAHVGLV